MEATEQHETDAELEGGEAQDQTSQAPDAASPPAIDFDSEAPVVAQVPEPLPPALELATALEPLQATMAQGFADLLRAFEDKLAYDRAKERQIDRLHAELQEHKRDLVAKVKRPMIQGLVRLHDDLGKVIAALGRRTPEELTPQRFFNAFDGFADDIELLLGQHGIEAFSVPGQEFDPRRQTALRTEATDDPDLAGTIAERLRSGFAEGETLLQKERVAVFSSPARSGSSSDL